MGIVDTFADSAEKGSIPYRLSMMYLYVFSGAGAVFIVDYAGVEFPYYGYALGVVFLLGYLVAAVAIAYVINAEYDQWEQLSEAGDETEG
ncbi:MAG: hypothetical protein ACOCR0_01000 [Haloferacaceae archaeon]